MKNTFFISCLVVSAMLSMSMITGCSSISVTTDYNPEFNFGSMSSYAIVDPSIAVLTPQTQTALVTERVNNALESALNARGYSKKPKDQANLSIAMGTLGQAGWMFLLFLLLSSFLWFSTARHLFAMNSRAATAQLACLSLLTGLLVQGIAMPAIAEFRSYRSFMTEVDRRIGEEPLYIHGRGWDYTSAIFYRGDRIRVLKTDQLPLQEQLQKSRGYYIMSEREWKKMDALGAFTSPPELRSRGTGPDGRDRIVLIRGRQGREGG